MAEKLGKGEILNYIQQKNITKDASFMEHLEGIVDQVPFSTYISKWNTDTADEQALDLLEKILQVFPEKRPTATEILQHPYL